MSGRTFDSAGVPIRFVDDEGSRDAVLLVHGMMSSLEMWAGVTPLLEGRFRRAAVDCRGHGRSGRPHAADAHGLEMVADVLRLLDELSIEGVHVVGYSMGAEIALRSRSISRRG